MRGECECGGEREEYWRSDVFGAGGDSEYKGDLFKILIPRCRMLGEACTVLVLEG